MPVVHSVFHTPVRRDQRLRSRSEFDRARASGGRVSRPEFVLYHFAREAGSPRVGFAVGRRVGGAVVRNRTRRRLREAVRPLLDRFVACDLVIVARPPAVEAGVADLERALADAATRAGLFRR